MGKKKEEWDRPTQNFMTAVGENLRELREATGKSVRGFAKEVNVDPSLISRVERGQQEFSASYFQRFATVLHVPVTALMPDIPDNGQHPAPDP